MSEEDGEVGDAREELKNNQRKEKKELQAQIQV